jgi:NhaP-type Na+/H+ or K+/H+ antiporter
MGIVIGLGVKTIFTGIDFIQFNGQMFFLFVLPPILFAAGYNLKKRGFFKYGIYIVLFGIFATIITFILLVIGNILLNNTLQYFDRFSHNSSYMTLSLDRPRTTK